MPACEEVDQWQVKRNSESAPIPGALEALCEAAGTWILWSLRWRRSLNRLDWSGATGALAVGAARTKMLPLTEQAVATIACTMQDTLGMESRQLVQAHLVGRMLPAVDAATLSAVVATLEEAEGFLARRRGANRSGAVSLNRVVSTAGLDWCNIEVARAETNGDPASDKAFSVGAPECMCDRDGYR